MRVDLDRLIKQIEELRNELALLAKSKVFTDPEIIAASQMLDAVLNQYDRILRKKNNGD
ncbi:MAG: aspartyl-phosphate phosphatase Spo0E family protein [Gorillibacterium sp.]|nr:aspartyl-phosphate phosphatase Spo0E family protein [Gorillibacterium sp.]